MTPSIATNQLKATSVGTVRESCLAERAITIKLVPIADDARQTEEDLEKEWQEARPRIFGAMCGALSAALANIETTRLTRAPRMADFTRWVVAAEPGLGWDPGTFEAAYAVNRQESIDLSFESDLVAVAVRDYVEKLDSERMRSWEGTATELLAGLDSVVSEKVRNTRKWPKLPSTLGNDLERAAPALRLKKISIEKKHSGKRLISLSWGERSTGIIPPAPAQWEPLVDDGF